MSAVYKLLWTAPFICFIGGYALVSYLHTNKSFNAPNLVGKPLTVVAHELTAANLNFRLIDSRYDADLPEATVVHQYPAATTPIKENQCLYITVTKKAEPVTVPDLTAGDLAQAQALLEQSQLTLICHSCSLTSAIHNQIVAQYPQPGATPADKKVIVYVADSYQKPVVMPSFKGEPVSEVMQFLQLHGIDPTIVHTTPLPENHTCTDCIITDERPLSGTIILLNPQKPPLIQLQAAPRSSRAQNS